MFENHRADLQAQINAGLGLVQAAIAAEVQAQSGVDSATAAIPPLQDALNQAQTVADQSAAALAGPQDTLDQAQQAQVTADNTAKQAKGAVIQHLDTEPDRFLGDRNHPNPEWRQWNAEHQKLIEASKAAVKVLDDAKAAVAAATGPRDAAQQAATQTAAARDRVRNQLNVANAALSTAKSNVAAAHQSVLDAQDQHSRETSSLQEAIAKLKARGDRIVAIPLNRADLELAADAELGETQLIENLIQSHYSGRAVAAASRAAALAAHDRTIDQVQTLRLAITATPDLGGDPVMQQMVAALAPIVADSMAQRARPAADRTDRMDTARDVLTAEISNLQTVISQLTRERDLKFMALTEAADTLRAHVQTF